MTSNHMELGSVSFVPVPDGGAMGCDVTVHPQQSPVHPQPCPPLELGVSWSSGLEEVMRSGAWQAVNSKRPSPACEVVALMTHGCPVG